MNVEYRVQHTDGRDGPLERLLVGLPPALIVRDRDTHDPNPLRNYLRCLADPKPGTTHLCVIQDDAVVCRDFHQRLLGALADKPDQIVSLFVGGLPGPTKVKFLRALKNREPWFPVYMQGITHVVAMVWPVQDAAAFLDWFPPDKPIPGTKEPYRSDDMVVGYWARITKRQIWATVPCLVEHPDDVPSVAQDDYRKLGDRGRRAIHFADAY